MESSPAWNIQSEPGSYSLASSPVRSLIRFLFLAFTQVQIHSAAPTRTDRTTIAIVRHSPQLSCFDGGGLGGPIRLLFAGSELKGVPVAAGSVNVPLPIAWDAKAFSIPHELLSQSAIRVHSLSCVHLSWQPNRSPWAHVSAHDGVFSNLRPPQLSSPQNHFLSLSTGQDIPNLDGPYAYQV